MSLRTIAQNLAYRYSRRALERNGLSALFKGISDDAIPPSYDDLWALYRQVRKQQPKLIIEYGSGYSTVVLATALAENCSGHLISIDAQPEWLEHTRKMIPDAVSSFVEMRSIVPSTRTLALRPPMTTGEPGSLSTMAVLSQCHYELHGLQPDLIYLDGPAPGVPREFAVDGKPLTPVVLDLLDMEDNLAVGAVVIVDGRGMNCALLKANLSRPWKIRSSLRGATTFQLTG